MFGAIDPRLADHSTLLVPCALVLCGLSLARHPILVAWSVLGLLPGTLAWHAIAPTLAPIVGTAATALPCLLIGAWVGSELLVHLPAGSSSPHDDPA